MNKKFISTFLSFFLTVSLFTISLPNFGYAQTGAKTAIATSDLQKRLARIEQKVEARRKELGIPGMSLAIVKDGEVVLSKGYGYKSFEKQIPVTADTQFAIGSATKAFTALSVLISQDEGKLSLDDQPQKYLPYFKINDPEINKNIKIRNLLSHSSGLNRTDLGWITGNLTREEAIKVAGEAKPTAKLGERFLYQNVMYAAAGEIVEKVQKEKWEAFVAQKILKPLGMFNSNVSVAEMQKSKDYSYGYEYNFDTKQTRLLPTRDIGAVSPAGSINSSANDMTKWLKFVLNKGKIGDKQLISEKSYNDWISPQQKIAGNVSYGFGWFLQDWNGKKVIQHGGNIDGFNSMVALLPEENLGFVMLTNVSASSLGGELMPLIWETMTGEFEENSSVEITDEMKKAIGKYRFTEAGFDIEVKIEDGKFVAVVPGQPTYVLEKVKDNRYKLSNAPAGFFITFNGDSALLEQPQGNFTLPKVGAENKSESGKFDSAKQLVGIYESEQNPANKIEIKEIGGKAALVVGNQPPYPLFEKEKDLFGSTGLPDSYAVKVKRDAGGKLAGIILVQPEGEFSFKYKGEAEESNLPKMSAEEILAKTLDALGGAENWKKLNSRVTKAEIDFVNQGLKATATGYAKAPNKSASSMKITALGKQIATIDDSFDGTNGGEKTSFSRDEIYTGISLADAKFGGDFYPFLNLNEKLKSAEVIKTDKIGNEDVYVVMLEPKTASGVTYYISTKTFLPLRKTTVSSSSTSEQKVPVSETYADYRKVDGVMIPFKIITVNPAMGEIITYIKDVKHNVKIDEAEFKFDN